MTGDILWRSADAAAAMGVPEGESWTATGISIDSRTLEQGDLFFALAGPNNDGHAHLSEVFAKGAAAAVVHEIPGDVPDTAKLVLVNDTFAALQGLARAARQRSGAKVLAITGSVGKTSTKEAMRRVLEQQGKTHASLASLNNHWGVPLTLSRMPADCAFAIFEIGMNHVGEITPLVKMVRPDVALITNVEAVHLEFFDSVEMIADAKAEIFAGLSGDGVAVLNRDNGQFARLAEAARAAQVGRLLSFGRDGAASVRAIAEQSHPSRSDVTADVHGEKISYQVGIPGRHWVVNSLGVIAATLALGGNPALAAAALAEIRPAKGRGERHKVPLAAGSYELIDDSYNASPVAMEAAFETLATTAVGAGGRRIAVLGDMRELGAKADQLHAALADALIARQIDKVFCAGPHMKHLFETLTPAMQGVHVETSDELPAILAGFIAAGDAVLVKGSLGSRMGPVVAALLDSAGPEFRARAG